MGLAHFCFSVGSTCRFRFTPVPFVFPAGPIHVADSHSDLCDDQCFVLTGHVPANMGKN